ncbi:MAG: hypothetical protein SPF89_03300 [Sphaerochaetaceae bacterium]|nr:hypothetical protein [Spirochaetales bacterium]MDY5499111.1 hypothetical protein [Sphaerochaetaceae bacterium]
MKLPIMGKESVALLVPHKRSMLLLDGILGFDREKGQVTSLTEVDRPNLFFDGNLNGIPGYVCFELMAQTISAYDYLMSGGMDGKPKVGFILGVDKLKVLRPVISQGSRIVTTIRQECAIGDAMFSFVGESKVGDETVANATLMVYTVLRPEGFLG